MVTILIADDEMIERKYLRTLFSRYAHKYTVVGEAKNGREAVQKISQLHPDVVIMDINMPLTDGLTAAHRIKQCSPNTIILLNTAYAEFEFARMAVEYQLDAYLLKPAGAERILQTIDECLRRRRSSDSQAQTEPLYARTAIGTPEQETDPVEQVAEYIRRNPQLPLTLDDLAKTAHFSPTYLSRVFHQKMGMTVTAYITQVRIENAKYLLVNSTMEIQEVANYSGFRTTPHFNRVFKQSTGLSPMEYRHLYTKEKDEDGKV